MSDAITGVLIGGILTGIGTWFSMYIQHKKWKIEQRIALLEKKRGRLEELSKTTLEKLAVSIQNDSYSIEMMSDIDFLFPDNVSQLFEQFMFSEKTYATKQERIFNITREMKRSISKIDVDIESLLN